MTRMSILPTLLMCVPVFQSNTVSLCPSLGSKHWRKVSDSLTRVLHYKTEESISDEYEKSLSKRADW